MSITLEATECYNEAIKVKSDYAEFSDTSDNVEAKIQEKEGIRPDRQRDGRARKALEAGEFHNEAIKIKPDHADAYYDKGVALGNLGKSFKAMNCYNEAINVG